MVLRGDYEKEGALLCFARSRVLGDDAVLCRFLFPSFSVKFYNCFQFYPEIWVISRGNGKREFI